MSTVQRRVNDSMPVTKTDGPLKVGDEGDAVRLLHQRLGDVGFDVGTRNGRFDDATVQAVRAFQLAVGLPVDGVADAAVWRCLDALPKLGSETPLPYRNPLNAHQPHYLPDYFPDGPPIDQIPWTPIGPGKRKGGRP